MHHSAKYFCKFDLAIIYTTQDNSHFFEFFHILSQYYYLCVVYFAGNSVVSSDIKLETAGDYSYEEDIPSTWSVATTPSSPSRRHWQAGWKSSTTNAAT